MSHFHFLEETSELISASLPAEYMKNILAMGHGETSYRHKSQAVPLELDLKSKKEKQLKGHIYPNSISLFCLSHSFVYLLYFYPSWDRS